MNLSLCLSLSSGFQQTGEMGETVVSEEVDSAPPPVKEQQSKSLVEEVTLVHLLVVRKKKTQE